MPDPDAAPDDDTHAAVKILVADDDRISRRMMETALRSPDHQGCRHVEVVVYHVMPRRVEWW